MGTDISGWVEILDAETDWWEAVVKIDHLVPRSYSMFCSLFGRCNIGQFHPAAADRGMPPKPSEEFFVEHKEYGGAVGTTWMLWSELTAVDWNEEEDPVFYKEGHVPESLNSRAYYIVGGWATLFDMMEILASDYGPENVRLSVWFDQ